MIQLKQLMLFRLLILVIQLRKLTRTKKINEIKNTMNYDYDKNITTQEFNKLTPERFTSKLAQTN